MLNHIFSTFSANFRSSGQAFVFASSVSLLSFVGLFFGKCCSPLVVVFSQFVAVHLDLFFLAIHLPPLQVDA